MASVLVFAGVSFVNAKTLVFPHALEVSGRITNTNNTFDTQFFMTYSGGLVGSPSSGVPTSVDLYVFGQGDGQPLKSATGVAVCNPCNYPLGDNTDAARPRKRTVVLDAEITGKGGFPSQVVLGFAIAVINGDVGNVNITSAVTNAKSSSLDLAVFVFEGQILEAVAN